ncbi:hypothetical protein X943_000523 [Babesia divergens]|uniref:DUF2428 domain-containing protein n=1 Tax=Babesia divergens TaxID=32595 RepID=A0AAD9GAC6_BABDI|nr:hypothetical protein X943_000523 [Babesia divergens]
MGNNTDAGCLSSQDSTKEDVDPSSEHGSVGKARVPSFSKSQNLRILYAELIKAVSHDPEWRFNVAEISHNLARGQISKALFDLEAYVVEVISSHEESGARPNITGTLEKLGAYVIHLYLEAEWLCLSKGFSSSCTSFLRLVPAPILTKLITECLTGHHTVKDDEINRRISDLYALVTCEEFLKLMGNNVLRIAMRLVEALGFETEVSPEGAGVLSAGDRISNHKGCTSALKALNLLLLGRMRHDMPAVDDAIVSEEAKPTLTTILRVLGDASADRDVLCLCGVSVVGLLHISYYAQNPIGFEVALHNFLNSREALLRKFEGDEGLCLTLSKDTLAGYDIAKPDHLVMILLSLPSLGCLSVVRGILTFIYSVYGKYEKALNIEGSQECKNSVVDSNRDPNGPVPFVTTILFLCHSIFKVATNTSLRVDLNYATLQGLQLMMCFISQATFRCPQLYQCMLELPELILTFWTRKVRRISNLAICTWSKLMDLSYHLAKDSSDPVIVAYTQQLVRTVTTSFGTNLKLRYLALQSLVRYVGLEEILRLQPFIISHLLCSLSVLAIRGCAAALLTDMLTRLYATVQEIYRMETNDNGSNTPLMVFRCLIYPTIIAILHSKQLVLPSTYEGQLAPRKDVSVDELELRVSALADSFKNIFGKIQKDYVYEMLRLSTSFARCDFYSYLSDEEKMALTSPGPYVVRDDSNLVMCITDLIRRICSMNVSINSERITYLGDPFNFAESICLYNAKGLNSVDFVDVEIDGYHLRGALINDSPTVFKFDAATFQSFPQVRLFYIPLHKLQNGLGHIRNDICINVLRTVAHSPKTKQPVSTLEMELILYALHHCMKTSLPSFRQHFVAAMKPFIKRLYAVVSADPNMLGECIKAGFDVVEVDPRGFILRHKEGVRITETHGKSPNIIALHCAFIHALLKAMVATINPCTSDFKNTTALELLYTAFSVFAEDASWTAQLTGIFNHEVIVPLFMALFYMSTKQQDIIFKILQLLPPPLLCHALRQYGGEDAIGYICRKSAASLWSVKTLPYMSGAKAMTLLLRSLSGSEHIKVATLSDDIESALIMSETESESPNEHDAVLVVLEYLLNQLDIFCAHLETHIDVSAPSKSSCPAGLLSLFSHYMDSIPVRVYTKVVKTPQFVEILDRFYTNAKRICDRILKYVGHQHDQEATELKGYKIDCRGHLITKDQSYAFTCATFPEPSYMDCGLCNNSFECFKLNLFSTPKCSVPDDGNLRPFTVLCWKTILEFCEAMRAMFQWMLPPKINGSIALCSVRSATLDDPGTNVPLLYDKLNDIGRYLISSLMSCRHFGCTDSLADLLMWICKKLVLLGLQCLLKEWVTILLDLLKGYSVSDQQWNELFSMLRDSHRRSEPIGRAFTSILRAESDRHKPVLLPLVANTLLDLCNAERPFTEAPGEGFTVVDIRIHSLNIMCALFRCKELRWSNDVHVGAALCTSLRNLSHGDWSVRNSASLLFSSVLHHLVGNDVNATCSEALLDQKSALCNNKELSDQLNSTYLQIEKMTVLSSETYESLNPPPDYSALYQTSTFVFNFLSRIPLYSFPAAVASTLSRNIGCSIYSSNASIRIMAAKVLAKNHVEYSRTNFCSLIMDKCNLILSEMGQSNHVNGILLFIRECLELMIVNGLYDLMDSDIKHVEIFDKLPMIINHINTGETDNVWHIMASWPPSSVLLATMHVVLIGASCFENVVLALSIVEKLCLVYTKTANVSELITHLVGLDASGNAHLVECMTMLALYSADVLGDELYQRYLETLGRPSTPLCTDNANLQGMINKFNRIRDDDMIKVKAASTLVSVAFMLTRPACYFDKPTGNAVSPFVEFTAFLIYTLHHNSSRQRVLEAALNQVSSLISRDGIPCWSQAELYTLWKAALGVLSETSQYFIHISVFRLLNAIALHQMHASFSGDSLFDSCWISTFRHAVSERLLYNTDFLIETWRSCHLYALYHFRSSGADSTILEMAAGLLMKMVDPASDVTMRKCAAQFLHDSALMAPIEGVYPNDPRGMYALHVFIALMILLQDENENIRTIIVACCLPIVSGSKDNLENLKSHICMERLLEFALRTMPVEWVIRAFKQLTMLREDLYNPLNHKLEVLQQQIPQRRICLTTAAIDMVDLDADHITDMSVLAEMDTVFNVEPQNMYTETLIYMVYVDKLLCKVVRSQVDSRQLPMVPPKTADLLHGFVNDSATRIMGTLVSHLSQKYEVGMKAHSIAADPLVISCCVVGLSRSCLAVLWPSNSVRSRGSDWERLYTFHNILSLVGRVWSSSVDAVYKAMSNLERLEMSSDAQMMALSEMERFLNLF